VPRTADTLDPLEAEAGPISDLPGCRRERLTKEPVEQADLASFTGTRPGGPQDHLPQFRAEGLVETVQQLGSEAKADTLDLQESCVDAIDARARRQPDNPA
jgi:hypothetical protein